MTTEKDLPQMEFSKARMAALRVVYFLIALSVLIVAKAEFGLSNQLFMVMAIAVLVIIILSYPIQMKMIYSVAYKHKKLGPRAMIGLEGSVIEDVSTHGRVRVRGEIWKARSRSGLLRKGEDIVVLEVEDGLTLVVGRVSGS